MRVKLFAGICFFVFPLTSIAFADIKGECRGSSMLMHQKGMEMPSTVNVTDVYRFANGFVFHRWSGREEYKYNSIERSPTNSEQYLSGNYRFIFGQKPLAIHADEFGWKVITLKCTLNK